MSILQSLISQNIFWTIPSQRLPPNMHQYHCQFVTQQYQLNNQIKCKNFLQFTNPKDSSKFQIIISQVDRPSYCLYEAEIEVQDVENPRANLNGKISCIGFTEVKGYQKPQYEFKEIELDGDESFDNPGETLPFLDLADNHDLSDSDQASSQCLIDYGPENQKVVRHQILVYIKENRFKKLKDIKAHLQTRRYNVPDNHIKRILTEFCGTHISDKKNGFLIHDEYLSVEEKVKRKLQKEEAQKKEKQKEEKKVQKKKGKKQSKGDKTKMVISADEVVKFAEGQRDMGSMRKVINNIKGKK